MLLPLPQKAGTLTLVARNVKSHVCPRAIPLDNGRGCRGGNVRRRHVDLQMQQPDPTTVSAAEPLGRWEIGTCAKRYPPPARP